MMTIDEALIVLDALLGHEPLTHLQETVFRCAWDGQTYAEIAKKVNHAPDYVKLVGSQLWQTISDQIGQQVTKNNFRVVLRQWQSNPAEIRKANRCDWSDAVDTFNFCGRNRELAELEQWIVDRNCRFVSVLGMGGIGKTVLTLKLAQQVQSKFESVIWRSLRDAASIDVLLTDLVQFLSNQQETELPKTVDGKIGRLMQYLRSSRCLIVLDNVESILDVGDRAGHYPIGYESYGDLFRRIAETAHQSCLVLTSREKLPEILESETARSFRLSGLSAIEAVQLLQFNQLVATAGTLTQLIELYRGNPLALKIAAATIQELFDGDVAEFLHQKTAVFGDITTLLNQQFDRLSDLEKQIMTWLAINRDGATIAQLAEDIVPLIPKRYLIDAASSIARRPIVEKQGALFTLQPVVMEYVINRLIDRVFQELCTEEFCDLMSYALIKASVEDHVRDRQKRMILEPLIDRLTSLSHCSIHLEDKLRRILIKLRDQFGCTPGYAAGNVLNLLICLNADLTGYDFSDLAVWQAHLQTVDLHQVNFSRADFKKSVFAETLSNVWTIAFNFDSTVLAAGDTAGNIHLWRVADYQKLLVCEGHHHWICGVAFSNDGNTIVSCSGDNTIKFWNAQTGECLHTISDHADWVISIALSPDNRLLASSGADRTVRIWDFHTQKCLQVLEGHQHWICSIAFDPTGSQLASASDDRTVMLWDIKTGALLQTLEGHRDPIRAVVYSPDGRILATGSEDTTIKIWNPQTGACLKTLIGHGDQIRALDFSSDGKRLISGSFDHTLKVWDRFTGHCLKTLQQHRGVVRSVQFSRCGHFFASGGADQSIRVWHAQTGECIKTLQGYTNLVLSAAFSPNSERIASSSSDQTVSLWNPRSSQCLNTLHGHTNWVWSVAFSPDSSKLASSSFDQTIRVWDCDTGACLQTLRGHTNWVWSVAFSRDGTILASGSFDQTLRLWNVESGNCLIILIAQSRIWSICFANSDEELLASGAENGNIDLWNPHTRECLQTLIGHTSRVMSLAFSADGKTLISGSEDCTIRIWDIKTRQCLQVLHDRDRVLSIAVSPSGKIASAGVDRTVKLWNLKTGICESILTGHVDRVWSVAFSIDGRALISGSEDQTIRIWNAQTAQCVRVLQKPRPYDGMSIANANGITPAQKMTLKALGAVE